MTLTYDQAFFFFWRADEVRGKKNNAWYIYLTSRQPPSNLNKQTSTLPVKLMGQSAFARSHCRSAYIGQLEWRFSEVLFLSQSEKSPESGIFTWDPTKKCIMPSFRVRCKGKIGRGHDLRLVWHVIVTHTLADILYLNTYHEHNIWCVQFFHEGFVCSL